MKIQRRCIRDRRGSSGTGSSDAYIICGTQARLFNSVSIPLHYVTVQINPKNSAFSSINFPIQTFEISIKWRN